ncbi:hypothetical protein CDL15_Pgr019785 [Punica granatum]|uniref:Bromo domain-containing protein n=1 Tax=Punica granatum TaxID=22663 RepID=A0A218X5K6_PUNGR|nr:hypothetical protein CDL15_Pgr019785 [Punica granatum]
MSKGEVCVGEALTIPSPSPDPYKRSLKEQGQDQGRPNSAPKPPQNYRVATPAQLRRSTRRNPAPDGASSPDERDGEDSSPGGRRREKKLKLVLKLPNSGSGARGGPDSGAEEDGDEAQNQRKRKIAAIGDGSGAGVSSEKGEKLTKSGNGHQAAQQLDSGVSTPLPDKKLLLFILDRLQKKDTYGVFSEPVDPEELPDYHDIIEHPMDFGTVRKKLASGDYAKLEQFESDVFLICSNAMQYNAPDTVYFRQARSIQELARKNFDNLRQDSDVNEPEPKVVRRGRPPTKHLKRPPGRPPLDRAGSSDATLATGGENAASTNFDLRKGSFSADKSGLMNSSGRLRNNDVYASWLLENRFERNDEYAGASSKGSLMKLGKKQTVPDENRRNTYKQYHPSTSGREPTVLATFNRERKQLMPVGLQADHGYARSLARFAANLGPVAWKVASRMIERSLPAGVKFGPGWVGDDDYLPPRQFQLASPGLSSFWPFSISGSSGSKDTDHATPCQQDNSADKPEGEHSNSPEKHPPSVPSSEPLPPPSKNRPWPVSGDEGSKSIRPPFQNYTNGFTGPFGYNSKIAAAHMGKMIGARPSSGFHFHPPSSVDAEPSTDTSSHHRGPTDSIDREDPNTLHNNSGPTRSLPQQKPELVVSHQQKHESVPPDLNIRFHSPGSPNSTRVDPAQPDLALQL